MARARNIKPGFFKNEDLADVSLGARLLFIGLWTIADREGYLEDRPRRIKAELFPMDNEVDVDEALEELNGIGAIVRYESEGINCIFIPGFEKHQNPHHKERPSDVPRYKSPRQALDSGANINNKKSETGQVPDRDKTETSQEKASTSPADSLLLIPDSLNPEEKISLSGDNAKANYPDEFEFFWAEARKSYARIDNPPGNKLEAYTEFKKLKPKPDRDQIDSWLKSLERQSIAKKCERDRGRDPAQLKHVCRWLKYRGWEDEVISSAPARNDEDDIFRGAI